MRSDVGIWMPKAADVRIHPITELFPDMSDGEFDALVADIREHGVRHPILLHEDQIVDGINRFKACKKLGVPCPSKEWDGEGSLLDLVISLNVRRRHLNGRDSPYVTGNGHQFSNIISGIANHLDQVPRRIVKTSRLG